MSCPPLNQLLGFSRNLLPETESIQINTHLQSGCGNCEENLNWLGQVGQLAAQDHSFAFPEETIKGLVAWFKSQPAPASQSVRKLFASLIFDSLIPGQVAFVRKGFIAGQPPAGRQMLFQAEGYDIDLRFEAIEDKAMEDLIGQILPQTEAQTVTAGVTVQLCQGEQQQAGGQTDEQGLFRFTRIPSGIYDLKIVIAGVEINLSQVPTARAV